MKDLPDDIEKESALDFELLVIDKPARGRGGDNFPNNPRGKKNKPIHRH